MRALLRILWFVTVLVPGVGVARETWVKCLASPEQGKQIAILGADFSFEACRAGAIACTGDSQIRVDYGVSILVTPAVKTCNAPLPNAAPAAQTTTAGPNKKIGEGDPTVPIVQAPITLRPELGGAELGDYTVTRSYGAMDSGPGTAYAHYSICTPAVPSEYRILAADVRLRGDRRECGVHAVCKMTSDSPKQVCWDVALQGHDEGGLLRLGNPDGGRRRTDISLDVRLMHTSCLPNWEVKWHSVDDNGAKAPLNDAPCFTHKATTGAAPNIDSWYRIKVGKPGTLRIVLSDVSAKFILQLRAGNQAELARLPASSASPLTLSYRLTKPGEYLVRPQPEAQSSYQLKVLFTPE